MHRRSHHLDIDNFSSKNRGHKEASDFQTGLFGACFMWRIATRWRTVLFVKTWLCWQKVLLSKERVEAHMVGQRQRFHRKIACRCFFQTNCAFFLFRFLGQDSFSDSETVPTSIVDLRNSKKGCGGVPQEYALGDPGVSLGESTWERPNRQGHPKRWWKVREIPRRFPGKSRLVKY